MRSNTSRTSPLGSSPPASKKSPPHKERVLIRTHSLYPHKKLLCPDSSPPLSSRPSLLPTAKPSSLFKLPPLHPDHSHMLESLRLPKTDPPSPVRNYAFKKRFGDMGGKLDRIPSDNWLSTLLYCQPEFSRVLASNLERCKEKLARSKLVKAAIYEEDGGRSDLSLRSLVEEQVCE